MKDSLDQFRRVEVKATLQHGAWLWLGTADGLYRTPADAEQPAVPVAGWAGMEIQALAADGDGLLVCAYDGRHAGLARCDGDGAAGERLTLPEGQKVKAVLRHGATIWVGTKQGVFRRHDEGWRHVFGQQGKAEVIGLWHDGASLRASVKKLAPDDLPALIESADGGDTWEIEVQPDYQDLVVAATAETIITKWRGARPRGTRAGFKKHPITAGRIEPGGRTAVVDGDKLEVAARPGEKLAAYHPAFGDAEHVHLLTGGMVVAGPQGAYRFRPSTGALGDLLPTPSGSRPYGKIKRLYQLDHVLLAATTFGTFRSFDAGQSWERCDAEWWVLDTEHVARGPGGRWWIACQRGLFRTDDQGGRIDYHKMKVAGPHYGELRSLAVAGERVCVGTKQGLFVNRPDRDPEQFLRIDSFGTTPIEGLAWDDVAGLLYVGGGDGRLHAWDLVTAPATIAETPIHEATMTAEAGRVWLASGGAVRLVEGRTVIDMSPGGAGDLHLLDIGERLLAWDHDAAWLRPKRGGGWNRLPGWAPGIRHVAHDRGRDRLITTDRTSLNAFDL
ncbi:MAG: hypothetical protein OHK0024_16210 [Thalassobaculales bacterium]